MRLRGLELSLCWIDRLCRWVVMLLVLTDALIIFVIWLSTPLPVLMPLGIVGAKVLVPTLVSPLLLKLLIPIIFSSLKDVLLWYLSD